MLLLELQVSYMGLYLCSRWCCQSSIGWQEECTPTPAQPSPQPLPLLPGRCPPGRPCCAVRTQHERLVIAAARKLLQRRCKRELRITHGGHAITILFSARQQPRAAVFEPLG